MSTREDLLEKYYYSRIRTSSPTTDSPAFEVYDPNFLEYLKKSHDFFKTHYTKVPHLLKDYENIIISLYKKIKTEKKSNTGLINIEFEHIETSFIIVSIVLAVLVLYSSLYAYLHSYQKTFVNENQILKILFPNFYSQLIIEHDALLRNFRVLNIKYTELQRKLELTEDDLDILRANSFDVMKQLGRERSQLIESYEERINAYCDTIDELNEKLETNTEGLLKINYYWINNYNEIIANLLSSTNTILNTYITYLKCLKLYNTTLIKLISDCPQIGAVVLLASYRISSREVLHNCFELIKTGTPDQIQKVMDYLLDQKIELLQDPSLSFVIQNAYIAQYLE